MKYRIKYQNIVFAQGLNSHQECQEWLKNNNKDGMIMVNNYHAVPFSELTIEEYEPIEEFADILERGSTLHGFFLIQNTAFFRLEEE